ncbi:MAG: zinc-ribbon domain-containing protein [Chloroflexi bacterium]|nr:zinc-ribbon domain-containing protein [Chloroflexota bacterium]
MPGNLLQIGIVLNKRYSIVKLLGQGNMGAVYLVDDLKLNANKQWALKQLLPENSQLAGSLDPQETAVRTALFHSEARLLARLDHPLLPKISDAFTLPEGSFLVMDYVPGLSLQAFLRQDPPPWDEVRCLRLALDLCDVLEYMHTRRPPVIFRDLKPDNIMLLPDNSLKLIDFGIARVFTQGKAGDTVAFGTPGYAAPEQFGGQQSDARADIFALGALLHYLLSGQDPEHKPNPFVFSSLVAVAYSPPGVQASPQLDAILARAVDLDREKRFASARQLRDALAALDKATLVCKHCWRVNPALSRFCLECGAETRVGVAEPPVIFYLCPQCQAQNRPGARFCISCGADLAQSALPPREVIIEPECNEVLAALTRSRLGGPALANQTGDTLSPAQSLQAFWLRSQATQLSLASGFDRLLCLDAVEVDYYEYQQQAALRALGEMRGRVILADEVGLGKTIEAGLILKELSLRRMVQRVLILVPSSLAEQWQGELREKFHEDFLVASNNAGWHEQDRVIFSLERARREPHASYLQRVSWDLIIVDEAHKLKNRATQTWRFVHGLKRRYLLLLTATPLQNDLNELYNLVTLLKPGQLGTPTQFRRRFITPNDPRQPRDAVRLRGFLNEVMIRNRRGSVGIELPPRRVETFWINMSPAEMQLYQSIQQMAQQPKMAGSLRLELINLQKESCSSLPALRQTLYHLSHRSQRPELEYQQFSDLYYQAAALPAVSGKVEALVNILGGLPEGSAGKLLVFTQYRQTQKLLTDHLSGLGFGVVNFNGDMSSAERREALHKFRYDMQIMISTESGSEGHNLQYCHQMVNYDLPWNPLKIEQRIGRVHRLGQKFPVRVYNLAYLHTMEEYLLRLLQDKIRLFELVVGELDLILGSLREDFESALRHIWLESQSEVELQARLKQFGIQLDEARQQYEQIRQNEIIISRIFE